MLGIVPGGRMDKMVEVHKVENGWMVNVHNPQSPESVADSMKAMLPVIKGLTQEPWQQDEHAEGEPPKVKPPKPVETYVFLDQDAMLAFVRKMTA